MVGRRNILAKIYAANLKRFIFNRYDDTLDDLPNEVMNGNGNAIDGVANDVEEEADVNESIAAISIKKEPVFWNDPDLVVTIDDFILIDENVVEPTWVEDLHSQVFAEALVHNANSSGSRDHQELNLIDTQNTSSVNSHEPSSEELNDDGIENSSSSHEPEGHDLAEIQSNPICNGIDILPPQPKIKTESPLKFLNMPNEVLDVSDEIFDSLREELAYDDESDDSDSELQKEFDHLVESGVSLPKPKICKLETNNDTEEMTDVTEEPAIDTGETASGFEHDEFASCEIETSLDPVLGNIPRKVNVSSDEISNV